MTVYVYRGIAAGWQPVGYRDELADAQRLIAAARRIRPQFLYRLAIGWPVS